MRVALRGDVPLADLVGRGPDVVPVDREAAADLLLVVGESALRSLADDPAPVPALPIDADVGPHGLASDRVDDLFRSLTAGGVTVDDWTVSHPLLSITAGDVRAHAVLDVALVTSEAARISEYAVDDATGRLALFRADGVVVATPAGSAGYGHAAGGPVLTTGTGFVVVPISPYTTDPSTWVVDAPVRLAVERDETPVSLVVDGRVRRSVVDDPIRLDVGGTVDMVRPPDLPSETGDGGADGG